MLRKAFCGFRFLFIVGSVLSLVGIGLAGQSVCAETAIGFTDLGQVLLPDISAEQNPVWVSDQVYGVFHRYVQSLGAGLEPVGTDSLALIQSPADDPIGETPTITPTPQDTET
ncbi:MAG TPA: hypothetical protein PKH07_19105, partial [bacterium]|nr:hypothetical protein [bacterium]